MGLQDEVSTALAGRKPQIKVLLVKDSMNEFEDLIYKKGWKISNVFSHAKGAIFILQKD